MNEFIPIRHEHGVLYSSNDIILADTEISELDSYEEDDKVLSHIVKCVNLHDELVEALLAVRYFMKKEFNNIDDSDEEFSIVIIVEEAIKKAGAL